MIVLTYIDDCILVRPSMIDIYAFAQSTKNGPEIFVLIDEGDVNKCLGIEINHIEKKIFKLSQPFFIDRIISLLNIDTNDYGMDTNAKSTSVGNTLLYKDLSGKLRKEVWNYETEVGMLNYLQINRRPEMSMTVHQTTCFCNNPMLSHEKAIKRLRRYLLHTKK